MTAANSSKLTFSEAYDEVRLNEAERQFVAQRGLAAAGLAELQAVRRQCAVAGDDSDHMAVWIVAPVLAGFTAWMAKHIRASRAHPLGVMREGRFLCQLLKALYDIPALELAVNRNLGLLAAYACGDDEALLNWLVRTRLRPLTGGELEKILPDYNSDAPEEIIDLAKAEKLLASWRQQGSVSPAAVLAEKAAVGLLAHWQKNTAQYQSHIFALMDFASAGNVQRSLQTVLRARNSNGVFIGLNFATTRGTRWTKQRGCTLRGFLAEDHAPDWIADACARTPELMEIFVAAPLGPLLGYNADGEPEWQPSFLSNAQRAKVKNWQEQILTAAKTYQQVLGDKLTPELCRCLWGRLLLQPLPPEALVLADWPLDLGLDGSAQRTLAPRLSGQPDNWSKVQTAWPAASATRPA